MRLGGTHWYSHIYSTDGLCWWCKQLMDEQERRTRAEAKVQEAEEELRVCRRIIATHETSIHRQVHVLRLQLTHCASPTGAAWHCMTLHMVRFISWLAMQTGTALLFVLLM